MELCKLWSSFHWLLVTSYVISQLRERARSFALLRNVIYGRRVPADRTVIIRRATDIETTMSNILRTLSASVFTRAGNKDPSWFVNIIIIGYRNISQRSNDISGRKRLLEIRMYHLSDKVSDERALTNFTLALMTKILTRFLHHRLFYVKLVVLCLFLVFIITTLNDWRQLQLWSGGVA